MGRLITTDQYRDAKFERNAHGAFIVDGVEVAHTLQCPHCGGHFVSRKGSGHRRSWCLACNAVCCGKESCLAHIPFDKRVEIVEKVPGLLIDQVPAYLALHPEIKVTVL